MRSRTLAVLFLSASLAEAQSGKSSFRRYTGSVETVSLNLETGSLTRGPLVGDRSVSTCTTFPNLDLGGFTGIDTGSCACEWIDSGVKAGGKSELMTGFSFAYCSAARDPLSGGVGGTTEVFFREGYTLGGTGLGGPPNGIESARFLLTGMPANTTCSGFFGGFRCFFLDVSLGDAPVCLADGPIGWGWKFMDLGSDGVLAKTWPFMACVQSCTAGATGPDGLGVVNLLDQYCPPGTLLSTFSFGTTCFGPACYANSIAMEIREAVPRSFPTAFTNGTGLNPVALTDGASNDGLSPALGDVARPFAFALDCAATDPTCTHARVEVRASSASTIFQCLEVLCSMPRFLKLSGPATFGLSVVLPKDLAFACIPYCVQGYCFGCATGCTSQNLLLSNAFVETVDV